MALPYVLNKVIELDSSASRVGHTHSASEMTGQIATSQLPSNIPASAISGVLPIASIPHGALERMVVVADEAARLALTSSAVQIGDTVKQADTGAVYYVKDDTKLNAADGYEPYTTGAATSVPWTGITGVPSLFPASAHRHNAENIDATGYTTALATATASAIVDTDDLVDALTKLTKQIEGKQDSGSYAASSALDTVSSAVDAVSSTLNAVSSSVTSDVVKLTGDQTISGAKTFASVISGDLAGTADEAKALTVSAGNSKTPVYVDSTGVPVAISYTIEKSVPSDAVFTDTNTKVTQSVLPSTSAGQYPILAANSAGQTAEVTATANFVAGITINPSNGSISAKHFCVAGGGSSVSSISTPIASGAVVTVPAYLVSTGRLNVYIEGIRCEEGDSYSEASGSSGTEATQITFNQAVDSTLHVTVQVI